MKVKDEPYFQARRAACLDDLATGGVPFDEAERWCRAWTYEAKRQRVPRGIYYWDAGKGWIDAQRAEQAIPRAMI